ncbi:unnamed protein product [Symbiodinium sp. CCMP2456]|nr:unnamed protein product [Symbiodinium sp. CCMP2456]
MSRADVQRPYDFLPPLHEAVDTYGVRSLHPAIAEVWFTSHTSSDCLPTSLQESRRKLLEQAVQQATNETPAAVATGANSVSERPSTCEELLQFLADWLSTGREALRSEFESKLRESYTWPVADRRQMVEVHRQKWRALEDSLRQLDDAIRAPSIAEQPELVERKAQASLSRLTSVRDTPLKLQVQVLREVKLQYWPSPSGISNLRPEDVPTDAEVDAWRDDMLQPAPVVQDRPGRESSEPVAPAISVETQTPLDILSDAVPMSLRQRPSPQGVPAGEADLIMNVGAVPVVPATSSRSVPEGIDGGLADVFAGMDEKEREAFATIVKEQDELAQQKAESERALQQKERSIQEQEEAFKDELETLRQEANKAESKLKQKAEEDILRKEQAHQAALHAEKEKLFHERYKLRTRSMGEQLVLEARKLKDELLRHRRIRPLRVEAVKVLWRTQEDLNRILCGKQLLQRRSNGATLQSENLCAFAIGSVREWLFRSREWIEASSFAPGGKTIETASDLAQRSEPQLKAQLTEAMGTIASFKARAKALASRMHLEQKAITPRSEPRPVVAEGLSIESEQAEGVRRAVAARLQDAEAKLDKLAEEDLSVDFLMRWSEQISAVGLKGMQTQRHSKELSERIEAALKTEATRYRSVAQAAYAEIAADREADESLKRAHEARKREEAREAKRKQELDEKIRREQEKALREKEKLVPLKLRMTGLRADTIEDKVKFGHLAEQKVAKALDLKGSQAGRAEGHAEVCQVPPYSLSGPKQDSIATTPGAMEAVAVSIALPSGEVVAELSVNPQKPVLQLKTQVAGLEGLALPDAVLLFMWQITR